MFLASAAQRGAVGLLRCGSLTVSRRCPTAYRCPLLPSRSCSSSPQHQPLRRWALSVSPFTTVRAQLACNITVHPLDPHAYPEADRAFITVRGPNSDQVDYLNHLQVHYDEQSQELLISAQELNDDVTIEMDAPIKSSKFSETTTQISFQLLIII